MKRVWLAVALTCAATVTGCASSGGSPPGAPGSTASSSPAAPASSSGSSNTPAVTSPSPSGPPACPTSALKVTLGAGQGYAGGVYEVIDFTNTSGSTCTLYGYPGVSLVTGPPYQQIGLAAKRTPATPPKLVTLAPGATGNAQLQIVDALNYPKATCDPVKATALKVYPPNQTQPVYLAANSTGCAKPVQIMSVAAVRPGSGSST